MIAATATEPSARNTRPRVSGPNRARRRAARQGARERSGCSRTPAVTTDEFNSRWGRVFLNNRYHDPTLGTFISVDPLVTITGQAFIYGAANPVTFSDPDGLEPRCFDSVNASCRYVNHEGKTIATRTTTRDPSTDRTTSTVTHFNVTGQEVLQKVQYRGHGGGDYQEVTVGADAGSKAPIANLTSEQGGNRGTVAVIQIGLSLAAFTPCGAACATGAALIASYQAYDTCQSGSGAQCGVAVTAAALSWAPVAAAGVSRLSSNAATVTGSWAGSLGAASRVAVADDAIAVSGLAVRPGLVLSSAERVVRRHSESGPPPGSDVLTPGADCTGHKLVEVLRCLSGCAATSIPRCRGSSLNSGAIRAQPGSRWQGVVLVAASPAWLSSSGFSQVWVERSLDHGRIQCVTSLGSRDVTFESRVQTLDRCLWRFRQVMSASRSGRTERRSSGSSCWFPIGSGWYQCIRGEVAVSTAATSPELSWGISSLCSDRGSATHSCCVLRSRVTELGIRDARLARQRVRGRCRRSRVLATTTDGLNMW